MLAPASASFTGRASKPNLVGRPSRTSRLNNQHRSSIRLNAQAPAYSGANVNPPLKGKHFLHIDDFSTEELQKMLDLGLMAKSKLAQKQDTSFKPFLGYSMCMIFTKPSARTRISFETVRAITTLFQVYACDAAKVWITCALTCAFWCKPLSTERGFADL